MHYSNAQFEAIKTNSRALAAVLITPVLLKKTAFHGKVPSTKKRSDGAFIKQLCYGSLRYLPKLDKLLDHYLHQSIKPEHADIRALLIIALYQYEYLKTPVHALVNETVNAAQLLGKNWAKGFINALLRKATAHTETLPIALTNSLEYQSAHPQWLARLIKQHWEAYYEQIIEANNSQPPMVIRCIDPIRTQQQLTAKNIESHLGHLSASSLYLDTPMPVELLPDFDEGLCHVQDEAAQLAAPLLALEAKQRVLDACSAPGGKATHCLQISADIDLTAVDIDKQRLKKTAENLKRINCNANIIAADINKVDQWFNGRKFHKIMLDAPCSGSGVIRRHPDIKQLRRPTDIENFSNQQKQLLKTVWPFLEEGGLLLYITCSIFPEENNFVIEDFIHQHKDCAEVKFNAVWGIAQNYGRQILPKINQHDGFYYALLKKNTMHE